jgi:hypothetical protein
MADVEVEVGHSHKEDDAAAGDVPPEGEMISGWADSIAKILKSSKPKHKKELILSRARKDYEVISNIILFYLPSGSAWDLRSYAEKHIF